MSSFHLTSPLEDTAVTCAAADSQRPRPEASKSSDESSSEDESSSSTEVRGRPFACAKMMVRGAAEVHIAI